VKDIKKDTTKEQLYALLLPESTKENEIARPKGVGELMWFGFVGLCFFDKFKVRVIIDYRLCLCFQFII